MLRKTLGALADAPMNDPHDDSGHGRALAQMLGASLARIDGFGRAGHDAEPDDAALPARRARNTH